MQTKLFGDTTSCLLHLERHVTGVCLKYQLGEFGSLANLCGCTARASPPPTPIASWNVTSLQNIIRRRSIKKATVPQHSDAVLISRRRHSSRTNDFLSVKMNASTADLHIPLCCQFMPRPCSHYDTAAHNVWRPIVFDIQGSNKIPTARATLPLSAA
ncbi:hypothetical protein CC80DRAFT_261584 [Byssothecium circinans]|uniref:Uncharacterized protein n=1 Tax=Byssothecium circinans TaxID=147558 RepID=A0A6A5U7F5_9PLEO|nr:hypothetical protein CC80DRAFT_261584 [Byssothecium circinans]